MVTQVPEALDPDDGRVEIEEWVGCVYVRMCVCACVYVCVRVCATETT